MPIGQPCPPVGQLLIDKRLDQFLNRTINAQTVVLPGHDMRLSF